MLMYLNLTLVRKLIIECKVILKQKQVIIVNKHHDA